MTDDIICVTQGSEESGSFKYKAICTKRADLLATSIHCVGTGCGGHPICRPCYELSVKTGLVVPTEEKD